MKCVRQHWKVAPRQGGGDRVDEAGVRVQGHSLHAPEAAGHQRAQEGDPGGAVLGGRDVEPQPRTEALAVDGDRVHDVGIDGPATLAALDDERVEGQGRVGADPSRGRVRKSSTIWSSVFARRETWLLDMCSIPSWRTSFSTRRVETPAR